MAEAVAAAMEARSLLIVEAGTGVGKSFAYLVPAILRCLLRGERVLVSTATISLQEQLINKDIPLLAASLDKWGLAREDGVKVPPLNSVLAKGRGNYLSIRRLRLASQRQERLFADPEQRHSLHVIEDWAYSTKDGTLSSLPPIERMDVWDQARSDSDNCMGRKCPHHKECFYQEARRALEKANLVVCNHALFFSDLALRSRGGGGGGFLPPCQHLILDEAHGIEDAASEYFGLSLAAPRVQRLLRTLHHPRKNKGYLLEKSLLLGDPEAVERAVRLVEAAEQYSREFFDDLLDHYREHRQASGRVRRAGIIENNLTPAMRELAMRLRMVREGLEEEADRFELQSYARRASEIADAAEALIDQTEQGSVYWIDVEGDRGGRFGPRVTIACAPIEVGPLLREHLFHPEQGEEEAPSRDEADEWEADAGTIETAPEESAGRGEAGRVTAPARSIVLTSATLATRNAREGEHPERAETAFAHAMNNLGIDRTSTLQLGSPFDYARQARVVIDLTMPRPTGEAGAVRSGGSRQNGRDYNDALAERVLHHVRSTRGGAFVLFTSFATLYAVADRLRNTLEDEGIPLLAQGRDGSRQAILKQFTDLGNAALFGAASFWQGVDVRGERLRNVIITRLPFEPPDRPLTQARLERIEIAGGNAFMQDSLPRAILKFKQGFGRLIRSKSDAGRVVVLDPRIVTARYGKMFLEALPEGIRIERLGGDSDE